MSALQSLLGRRGLFTRAPHKIARIEASEGPRGYSTRAAVYARHVAYLLVVILCSATSHSCFQAVGKYMLGGKLMFGLAALTLASAAAGTVFYTNQRNEILEQARHYVFGMMVLPGTALALIMWGAQVLAGGPNPGGSEDQFLKVIFIGLPALYFCTVVIPPVLFIKMLAQIRTLHRSRLDDQEMMALWTRQDGRQL